MPVKSSEVPLERCPAGKRFHVGHPRLGEREFGQIVGHAPCDAERPDRVPGGRDRHQTHREQRARSSLRFPPEQRKAAMFAHEDSVERIVEAARAAKSLYVPTVEKRDLVTRNERSLDVEPHLTVDGREEPAGDVLRVPRSRPEVPRSGHDRHLDCPVLAGSPAVWGTPRCRAGAHSVGSSEVAHTGCGKPRRVSSSEFNRARSATPGEATCTASATTIA